MSLVLYLYFSGKRVGKLVLEVDGRDLWAIAEGFQRLGVDAVRILLVETPPLVQVRHL